MHELSKLCLFPFITALNKGTELCIDMRVKTSASFYKNTLHPKRDASHIGLIKPTVYPTSVP